MDEDQEMSDKSHSMITRSDKNGGTKKRKLLDVESGEDETEAVVVVTQTTIATQTLKKAASDDSDDDTEEVEDNETEADDESEEEADDDDDDDDSENDDSDGDYEPTQEEMELYEQEYDDDEDDDVEEEEQERDEPTENCECEDEDDEGADDEAAQERRAQANFARFSQMLFSNPPVVILRQQTTRQRAASDTTNTGQAVNPVLRSYSTDERKYYNTLSEEERALIDASEAKISVLNRVSMPMRFKILQSHIDDNIKAIAINKLQHQEMMSPASGEYHKLTNWLDALVNIPFGKYRGVPIIRDMTRQVNAQPFNPQEVSAFLSNTKNVLDSAVYGHEETKNQMIRFLAQWIVNPKSNGSVIGIHGRPGVGKTTLVKEGICKALDIPFVSIPLGGASDGSYLEGHSYTYEGSMWGKIVDVVMKAGCMNPIIYFDELDKVSTTSRGEEIINILIHLTDPGQNSNFSDKYFTDVPIDLSKCIIIFTYNDDSIINPILKDRLIRIEVNDYSIDDKIRIANNHLIPSLMRQFSFAPGEVSIADSTIKYIVNKIEEEAGVRNLRRSLELIYSTINLKRLLQDAHMEPRRKDSMGDDPVTLPVSITETMSDTLLKRYAKREDRAMLTMYT